MITLLVAVDGSESSARAVHAVINLYRRVVPVDIRLLHVRVVDAVPAAALSGPKADPEQAFEAGMRALRSAQSLLEQAGFGCTSEVRNGYVPAVIVENAKQLHCDAIVMGTRGMGSTADLIGSIARQVISLSELPVMLVK
ncbi:MAG TPA: universal stress protein [Casimicrobiaceae bacterium]